MAPAALAAAAVRERLSMSVDDDPALPAAAGARRWQAYARRVRALARTRWRPSLVFCALIVVLNAFHSVAAVPGPNPPSFPIYNPYDTAKLLTVSLSMAIALVLTDALGLRGRAHALASFAAIAATVGIGLSIAMVLDVRDLTANLRRTVTSDAAFLARELWINIAGGALLAAYFAARDREAEYARLAQATELARMRTERSAAMSRLKVLQARVEPELLFGTLSEVRELYARVPAAADALLDDLITYLRAALPQMRGATSTLGAEARLAAAGARLSAPARAGRMRVECRVMREVEALPFPPMVLLPLAQSLARSRPTELALTADRDAASGVVRVDLAADSAAYPTRWNEETVAAIRARLAQHCGDRASLAVGVDRAVASLPAPP